MRQKTKRFLLSGVDINTFRQHVVTTGPYWWVDPLPWRIESQRMPSLWQTSPFGVYHITLKGREIVVMETFLRRQKAMTRAETAEGIRRYYNVPPGIDPIEWVFSKAFVRTLTEPHQLQSAYILMDYPKKDTHGEA